MQVQPGLNNDILSRKKSRKLVLDSSEEQNTVAFFDLIIFCFQWEIIFIYFFVKIGFEPRS